MIRGNKAFTAAAGIALAVILGGCQQTVQNAAGTPTTYYDPGTGGPVRGAGIEGQDVVSMTDQMVRDMLAEPRLASLPTPPRVIVDSQYFRNDSLERIDRNVITDRLRVHLNRASRGRMVFVGRQYVDAVQHERNLARQGVVDRGTLPATQNTLKADYRLGGNITSIRSRSARTGLEQSAIFITFEMFDLETSEIVWSNMYEMSKASADDVTYR
jgi:PBP1b-binding outer membrane lipoprotein LpoB